MEHARSLGQALLSATMEGRGFVSEAMRSAQAQDRRPVVLLKDGHGGNYAQAPLGTNALVPPDAPLAPLTVSPEGREVEKCVRPLLVALLSNLCHRIWNPAALQESAWRVPDGKRLEDFVPAPAVPQLTATALAALPAPPVARAPSIDWMDTYAALARAPFTSFLSSVVKGAPTSYSALVLCHYQLETAAASGRLTPEALGGAISPRLVILAYLSLAAKYALDSPGSCRTWGRIGGVPPTVLAEAELAVLRSRNFELFVAPSDFLLYAHHLAKAADHMSFTGSDAPPPSAAPVVVVAAAPAIPLPVKVAVGPSVLTLASLPMALPVPLPLESPTTALKRKLPATALGLPPATRQRVLGVSDAAAFFANVPTDQPLPFRATPAMLAAAAATAAPWPAALPVNPVMFK